MVQQNVWEVSVNDNIINTNSSLPSYTYFDWMNPPSPQPYHYNWISTYPATIYKYQVACPKCDTMNWLELDKIETCKGNKCKVSLKAVSKKVDYEIAIIE